MYIHFCPHCCQLCGENAVICRSCQNNVDGLLIKSKHEYEYYLDATCESSRSGTFELATFNDVIREEIKDNPLYDDNLSKSVEERERKEIDKSIADDFKKESKQKKVTNPNIPHCPTCGSTDIKKISATRKAIGATLFGLFSKTATSQFECLNCGYKF